ncbi:Uncharacterised protein [uncultured archaeon]|nr:Uncharacterised protein [uncultured archaeon]
MEVIIKVLKFTIFAGFVVLYIMYAMMFLRK